MAKNLNNQDHFDDCAVCRAMKEADAKGEGLTERQLKEAFEKAKEEGAVVGGSYFDG